MGLNGDQILPSRGMISDVCVICRCWGTLLPSFLQVHISPSLIPEIALSVSLHGLTKSYSFISTVNTCISSDNEDGLNCLGLFLLVCLYAAWEINTQRSNLCISGLHAVPGEQH